MKINSDLVRQKNGRIVAPIFQRTDRLSGNTKTSGQFVLADSFLLSDFFNFVFQINLSSYST